MLRNPDISPPGQWKNRRRYLSVVTLFTMACMAVVILRGDDTRVAETVVTMGFSALIGFVATYVFGAAWDHLNARIYGDAGTPPTPPS